MNEDCVRPSIVLMFEDVVTLTDVMAKNTWIDAGLTKPITQNDLLRLKGLAAMTKEESI